MNRLFRFLVLFFFLFGMLSVGRAFAAEVTPLPPDQAFQLSVVSATPQQVVLQWHIAPGYHLYRQQIQVNPAQPQQTKLGDWQLPQGIPVHDAILGDYEIYRNQLILTIPLQQVPTSFVDLLVHYQGCSEARFCYPPVIKHVHIPFAAPAAAHIQTHSPTAEIAPGKASWQTRVEHLLSEKNYVWIMLAFIGFGLLLAFTPCVLPMIPILSGIIIGQDQRNLTMRRAFFLSLSYVLGMSLAYAIAGTMVALAGSHFTAAFEAPWIIILFSLVFVLLALSLFGLYELRLPHFVHHRVVQWSNKQKSGSLPGAFVMGALAVLIVSPCVTAPLVGVLTFIAQSGNVILGASALFALGIGMGLPLLVIGTTEGKFLPRSGPWMHVVKASFGVLLLAVAIYLLQRIIPDYISLLLWGAFGIIVAIYLGVGTHLPPVVSGWRKFAKGLGSLAFCYGVILLVGAALGHSDPLQPLRGNGTSLSARSVTAAPGNSALPFQRVTNLVQVQQALQQAAAQHRPVMLDFYADWCVACHELDRNTFSDPAVQAALQHFVLLRADVTANDKENQALEKYFQVFAPPTVLFFDANGKELTAQRIVGTVSAKEFLVHVSKPVT